MEADGPQTNHICQIIRNLWTFFRFVVTKLRSIKQANHNRVLVEYVELGSMKDGCSLPPPVGRMIILFVSESEKNIDLVKTNVV